MRHGSDELFGDFELFGELQQIFSKKRGANYYCEYLGSLAQYHRRTSVSSR